MIPTRSHARRRLVLLAAIAAACAVGVTWGAWFLLRPSTTSLPFIEDLPERVWMSVEGDLATERPRLTAGGDPVASSTFFWTGPPSLEPDAGRFVLVPMARPSRLVWSSGRRYVASEVTTEAPDGEWVRFDWDREPIDAELLAVKFNRPRK